MKTGVLLCENQKDRVKMIINNVPDKIGIVHTRKCLENMSNKLRGFVLAYVNSEEELKFVPLIRSREKSNPEEISFLVDLSERKAENPLRYFMSSISKKRWESTLKFIKSKINEFAKKALKMPVFAYEKSISRLAEIRENKRKKARELSVNRSGKDKLEELRREFGVMM